jgi:hypothetical protein
MKPIPPLLPRHPLMAEWWNALVEEVRRQGNLSVEGGDFEDTPGGRQLTIPRTDRGFMARVWRDDGGSDSGSGDVCPGGLAWHQQRPAKCGAWEDDPNGLRSTGADEPAFEWNANDDLVPDNTVVWLEPGAVWYDAATSQVRRDWRYQFAGFGAGPESGSGDSGSGDCGGRGTPLGDLIQCAASGSGTEETDIRNVCLAVRVGGKFLPVVAIDPVTGEVFG